MRILTCYNSDDVVCRQRMEWWEINRTARALIKRGRCHQCKRYFQGNRAVNRAMARGIRYGQIQCSLHEIRMILVVRPSRSRISEGGQTEPLPAERYLKLAWIARLYRTPHASGASSQACCRMYGLPAAFDMSEKCKRSRYACITSRWGASCHTWSSSYSRIRTA